MGRAPRLPVSSRDSVSRNRSREAKIPGEPALAGVVVIPVYVGAQQAGRKYRITQAFREGNMKAFCEMSFLVMAVIFTPVLAQAADCTPGGGPVVFHRIDIESNPLVSGQDGGIVFDIRNTGAQTLTVTLVVDVANDQHQVLLPGVITQTFTLAPQTAPGDRTAGAQAFSTAGAVFSGFIHSKLSVGTTCSDFVNSLHLVILPACPCPAALPPPIAGYRRPS